MDTESALKPTPTEALLEFYRAIEARSNARFALQTKLPGRKIYFRSEMRRAISKWRSYKELVRAGQ